jgi:hypothetical protein
MSDVLAGSRTARLINLVFFDGHADEAMITAGLHATRVRLIADANNLTSRAGQAALVTIFQLIARMGISIELLAADVPLVAIVQPLRRPTITAALLDLGADLIPGATVTTIAERAHVTFAIGDTAAPPGAIVLEADELTCALTTVGATKPLPITAAIPLGAMAGAAAAAAIALEHALPHIEATTGCRLSSRPRPPAGPPVQINLRDLFPQLELDMHQLGRIDAISGGAITNSFLQTLLWLADIDADIRVIERERADLTNLNRYNQLRGSDDDRRKIDVIAEGSTDNITITGVPMLFTEETRDAIVPLAERVVVGVDNIPARWWVQQEQPARLYVGATDNHSAVLSTHQPGQPCAGCAHPDPLPPLLEGDFIPTISIISFWAGFLQTLALLSKPSAAQRITIYPFALGGQSWTHTSQLPHGARCPINCSASRSAQAA